VLTDFGLDIDALLRQRPVIRYCIDWSKQRHHLAGPLGAALTSRLFELDWIRHTAQRRAVRLTSHGQRGLHDTFGLPQHWHTSCWPTQPKSSA